MVSEDTRRSSVAGVAGVVGGVLLALTTVIHNALSVEPETFGGTVSGVAHAVAYFLLLIALLGVHANFELDYGRLGPVVVYGTGIAFGSLVVVFPLLTFVFGSTGGQAGSARESRSSQFTYSASSTASFCGDTRR